MVNDRLELELVLALISDADHDIWLWRNSHPSMEERVVLAEMSRSLHYLRSIFRKQLGGWVADPEDGNCEDRAHEFSSLLNRAVAVRGVMVGNHLDQLAARLKERLSPTDDELVDDAHYQSPQREVENKFAKVGKTWEIEFGSESCRLPASLIGLDYISVLLQYAGKMITAVKLRETGASAVPADIGTLEELRDDSDPDLGAVLQTEWRSDLVLDEKARSEYNGALEDLRERILIAQDTGNLAEVSNLTEKAGFIAAELRKQTKKTGAGRQFSTQQENARTTVTHAIKRAVEEIAKYAPATAQHLQLNIITGTTLTYRDQSVHWKT